VIGGTSFVGRHLAEHALAAGHELTLLHRGRRNPSLFPDATHVLADRDGGLAALGDGEWDAVVDSSGYLPRLVGDSARYLADRVGRYLYVSTVSVYTEPGRPGEDEDLALATMADESVEEITEGSYGPLKALCEREVETVYGPRATVVRPTYVVGPYDPTERYTWWIWRIPQGGRVLAPLPRERPLQLIDGRDLAAFMLHLVEGDIAGTYNALGPDEPLTWGRMLDDIVEVSGADAELVWVESDELLAAGLELGELGLWEGGESPLYHRMSWERGRAAGLTPRPHCDTAAATLEWDRNRTGREMLMTLQRESAVLASTAP
jgi:2'-hydroxyisoflavone reductase